MDEMLRCADPSLRSGDEPEGDFRQGVPAGSESRLHTSGPLEVEGTGPRAAPEAALQNIRIVLVEPQHSGNIGAVARAMKNMALTDLGLVKPADHLAVEARMMAMHALDILQAARVYASLSEAIASASYVVGTTRRLGKSRQARLTPRALAPRLLELARSNRIALIFGREDAGLTNDELQSCHELVTIPAHPRFGSLNLAQAVLLVSYELYQAATDPPRLPAPRLATVAELERLYAKMRDVLLRVGFLQGSNPERMMGYFRRFFGQQRLAPRDVKIFLGVFRQIQWALEQKGSAERPRGDEAAGTSLP